MRARMILILAVALSWQSNVSAQVRQFPYDARVVVDEVYVRSGRGDNSQYYATQKLVQGDQVTVRRHEPGGWLMIEPPPGSFSWVPAKHVDRNGDEGVVSLDNSVAFVGSDFGDETGVWQRPLRAGEKVRILGERELDTHSGIQRMYKIEPPTREYRWIPGSAIVPLDESVRQQMDSDPYATPSQARRPPAGSSNAPQLTGVVDAPAVRPSPQLVRLQTIRAEQKELAGLDQRFRTMLRSEPGLWALDELETDYRSLQDRVTYRPVAGQIDLRYPAIEKYRLRKVEYEDYKRLTSQTEQRESQLLAALQNPQLAMSGTGLPVTDMVVASPGPESMMAAGVPPNLAQLFGGLDSPQQMAAAPEPFAGDLMAPVPDPSMTDGETPILNPANARSRYVGAGILTKPEDQSIDAPFVLTSPTGKVLAHLKPEDGVDVESYVGQSVGLHGSRWFKDDINSDYIQVSGLEPVKLR